MSLVTPSHETSGLLAVLENPELFKKRLEQLQETERKTQAVVDLAGPADEIVRMRKEIEADKEAAEVALSDALDQAEAIAAEAKGQAQLIVDKGTQEANRLTSEAESLRNSAAENSAAANSAVAAVEADKRANDTRAGELDGREASLQQQADALASREQELSGEKDKLTQVRDLINEVI